MFEVIIVIGIVAIVAFIAGRSFYRIITGKIDGCVCTGDCHGCAYKDLAKAQRDRRPTNDGLRSVD
jgi:hypothetical protein